MIIHAQAQGGEKRVLTLGVQTERHSYEKCQYEEFKKRVAKMDELREAKGGARSN
jgi:NADH dehydrogenase (ubiquinone) 1 beta subcomplex subunit 7